jgi:hypothetical protein
MRTADNLTAISEPMSRQYGILNISRHCRPPVTGIASLFFFPPLTLYSAASYSTQEKGTWSCSLRHSPDVRESFAITDVRSRTTGPSLLLVWGHVYGPAITACSTLTQGLYRTSSHGAQYHENLRYMTTCSLVDIYQPSMEHPASIFKVEVKCGQWCLQVPPNL